MQNKSALTSIADCADYISGRACKKDEEGRPLEFIKFYSSEIALPDFYAFFSASAACSAVMDISFTFNAKAIALDRYSINFS